MRSGDFDCQVTIEKRSTTQDAKYGTPVVTWVPLVTRAWAQVEDEQPSRSEAVRAGVAMATNRTTLRMRYRNDIDSTMRVWVYRDTAVLYQIVAGPAQVGGRKQMIEMVLERYSTAGTPNL
jgi:SPP1 family predicted phage head-tail adaptor